MRGFHFRGWIRIRRLEGVRLFSVGAFCRYVERTSLLLRTYAVCSRERKHEKPTTKIPSSDGITPLTLITSRLCVNSRAIISNPNIHLVLFLP